MLVTLPCQGAAEEVDVRLGAVALCHLAERFGEGLFGLAEHAQIDVQVHGWLPSGALDRVGEPGRRFRRRAFPWLGHRRRRSWPGPEPAPGAAAGRDAVVVGAGAGPVASPIFSTAHRRVLEHRLLGDRVPFGEGQFVGGRRVLDPGCRRCPSSRSGTGRTPSRARMPLTRAGTSIRPRREVTRTRSPSEIPSRSASSGASSTQASGAASVRGRERPVLVRVWKW